MENTIDTFLKNFENELILNENLRNYHRLINNNNYHYYKFRKAYFRQRLEYVVNSIDKKDTKILDIGCGYGTTAFLLASLGYNVIGTTLEYYYDQINSRYNYWKDKVDLENILFKYENLFKSNYPENEFDYIIVQDTIHHLEPINKALSLIKRYLNKTGTIIVIEENGNNIINNAKLFIQRGFNRIVEVYDEKLGETYQMGNENTRSLSHWNKLFRQNNLIIDQDSIEYIRLLPPMYFKNKSMEEVVNKEHKLWKKSKLLREFLYFGINFKASKV